MFVELRICVRWQWQTGETKLPVCWTRLRCFALARPPVDGTRTQTYGRPDGSPPSCSRGRRAAPEGMLPQKLWWTQTGALLGQEVSFNLRHKTVSGFCHWRLNCLLNWPIISKLMKGYLVTHFQIFFKQAPTLHQLVVFLPALRFVGFFTPLDIGKSSLLVPRFEFTEERQLQT